MEQLLRERLMSGSIFERCLSTLTVGSDDQTGGAALMARNLHQGYLRRGLRSTLAVANKSTQDSTVLSFSSLTPLVRFRRFKGAQSVEKLERLECSFSFRLLRKAERTLKSHIDARSRRKGHESFYSPQTSRLVSWMGSEFDLVHCHNLHPDYFDLRVLPRISRMRPLILTLHDAWLLGGHCAHSFDCDRWTHGCGSCPDLTIYPPIQKDKTARNWEIKKKIYAESRLFVVTPCQWLMNMVKQSILASGLAGARVIHNGVDLSIFKEGDKDSARQRLGLPGHKKILLFTSVGIKGNVWRDFEMLRSAIKKATEYSPRKDFLFLALGDRDSSENPGSNEIRFIPFHSDPREVALYYQASDAYAHPAKADTFPSVVIEALACGKPVISTTVGGIPEQVKGLQTHCGFKGCDNYNRYGMEEATGFLVPSGDSSAMAYFIKEIFSNDELTQKLGKNAAKDARLRFDLEKMISEYLDVYSTALKTWESFSNCGYNSRWAK
jgi:glycosyltransferase involved in cell wall biosynthesis